MVKIGIDRVFNAIVMRKIHALNVLFFKKNVLDEKNLGKNKKN